MQLLGHIEKSQSCSSAGGGAPRACSKPQKLLLLTLDVVLEGLPHAVLATAGVPPASSVASAEVGAVSKERQSSLTLDSGALPVARLPYIGHASGGVHVQSVAEQLMRFTIPQLLHSCSDAAAMGGLRALHRLLLHVGRGAGGGGEATGAGVGGLAGGLVARGGAASGRGVLGDVVARGWRCCCRGVASCLGNSRCPPVRLEACLVIHAAVELLGVEAIEWEQRRTGSGQEVGSSVDGSGGGGGGDGSVEAGASSKQRLVVRQEQRERHHGQQQHQLQLVGEDPVSAGLSSSTGIQGSQLSIEQCAAGTGTQQLTWQLLAALDDSNDDVRCAAATALLALLRRLRPLAAAADPVKGGIDPQQRGAHAAGPVKGMVDQLQPPAAAADPTAAEYAVNCVVDQLQQGVHVAGSVKGEVDQQQRGARVATVGVIRERLEWQLTTGGAVGCEALRVLLENGVKMAAGVSG